MTTATSIPTSTSVSPASLCFIGRDGANALASRAQETSRECIDGEHCGLPRMRKGDGELKPYVCVPEVLHMRNRSSVQRRDEVRPVRRAFFFLCIDQWKLFKPCLLRPAGCTACRWKLPPQPGPVKGGGDVKEDCRQWTSIGSCLRGANVRSSMMTRR